MKLKFTNILFREMLTIVSHLSKIMEALHNEGCVTFICADELF